MKSDYKKEYAESWDEWDRNVKFLNENRDRLSRIYDEGTYLVIENQGVIDSGYDAVELMKKYIPHRRKVLVTKLNPPFVEISTPEFLR